MLTDRLRTDASDLDDIQDTHTVSAFEALGAEARPAIPALIELLAPALAAARVSSSEPSAQLNDRKSLAAARALEAIGEDSVRPLIEALDAEPTNIRFGAAMALESFPRQAKAVVPALIKALEDKSPDVRWRAARSLGALCALPEVSVPALATKVLDDPDSSVRNYAIMALGKFGSKAPSSAPTLREATNHPSSVTQHYARKALEAIEPSAEKAKSEHADAGHQVLGVRASRYVTTRVLAAP